MMDRPDRVAILADRLIGVLAEPFHIGNEKVEIGASIGIAICPGDGDCQDALMRAADIALYRAKNEKRGSFRFFEPRMDEELIARKQLERDLQHAIAREQLQLYYQPVVDCMTGEVEGFEALLRWHHPERGMVPPVEFIPLAEASGLIVSIGEWVLQAACEAASLWTRPCRLAVNVSPVQFQQSDLSAIVAATLARTGFPASRLEIEITEGVLMTDPKRGVEGLFRLHKMGVSIALDDFGTGYSSLGYLQTFRFDRLKIDRSFIMRLGEAEDSTIIVRAIIGLAHNLGLKVVAEGVETAEQLAVLRDLSCDQVQGYLLGRPAQMADVTELITARARAFGAGHPVVSVNTQVMGG
jgi:predicted signal transduction protein with EAL and GGDEF domain